MNVLHLVPHPECAIAFAALDLLENSSHVGVYRMADGGTVRCFNIAVTEGQLARSTRWSFRIANRSNEGIHLPMTEDPICLSFVFLRSSLDGDACPSLTVYTQGSGRQTPRVELLDPLSTKEHSHDSPDLILETGRCINRPEWIRIGSYTYHVFMPWIAPGCLQLYRIAGQTGLDSRETDWRPTGRIMGEGGFGKVVCIRSYRTGQVRASKVIKIEGPDSERLLASARREIFVFDRLPVHSHVLRCFNHFEETQADEQGGTVPVTTFTFHLPLCHGTVQQLIHTKTAIDYLPKSAKETMSAILHLHSCSIAHLDVKPSNILFRITGRGETSCEESLELLTSEGQHNVIFILADFGLSRFTAPGQLITGGGGTKAFMAPEQLEERGHNEAVDICSLAAALLEVVYTREFAHIYVAHADHNGEINDLEALKEMMAHRYRFACGISDQHKLAGTICQMLNPNTVQRPTADAVDDFLKNLDWDSTMRTVRRICRAGFDESYKTWIDGLQHTAGQSGSVTGEAQASQDPMVCPPHRDPGYFDSAILDKPAIPAATWAVNTDKLLAGSSYDTVLPRSHAGGQEPAPGSFMPCTASWLGGRTATGSDFPTNGASEVHVRLSGSGHSRRLLLEDGDSAAGAPDTADKDHTRSKVKQHTGSVGLTCSSASSVPTPGIALQLPDRSISSVSNASVQPSKMSFSGRAGPGTSLAAATAARVSQLPNSTASAVFTTQDTAELDEMDEELDRVQDLVAAEKEAVKARRARKAERARSHRESGCERAHTTATKEDQLKRKHYTVAGPSGTTDHKLTASKKARLNTAEKLSAAATADE